MTKGFALIMSEFCKFTSEWSTMQKTDFLKDVQSRVIKYTFVNTVKLQWLEHQWLVYHGLFELIFESLRNFSKSSRKQILREIFYYEIVCCVYSLESPHQCNSYEYTQHPIILLKIENISINYRHLLPDLAPWLNLTGLNYPLLEQISMVPKMFEPLKFDCTQSKDFFHYLSLFF